MLLDDDHELGKPSFQQDPYARRKGESAHSAKNRTNTREHNLQHSGGNDSDGSPDIPKAVRKAAAVRHLPAFPDAEPQHRAALAVAIPNYQVHLTAVLPAGKRGRTASGNGWTVPGELRKTDVRSPQATVISAVYRCAAVGPAPPVLSVHDDIRERDREINLLRAAEAFFRRRKHAKPVYHASAQRV